MEQQPGTPSTASGYSYAGTHTKSECQCSGNCECKENPDHACGCGGECSCN